MLGAACAQLALDRGELGLQIVDQVQACVDGLAPRIRDLETIQKLAALQTEQIAHRARVPERHQRRMDAVLEHRLVLDQVQSKPRLLALPPDPRVERPDRRHEVAMREHRQHPCVDPVRLARHRASPLTRCASAISTSHPSGSSVSWMNRAPVIDSMTARTGSR
jgi:hypothetical protein